MSLFERFIMAKEKKKEKELTAQELQEKRGKEREAAAHADNETG